MLLDYSLAEIKEYVTGLGFPAFRGKQLFDAIYSGKKLNEISNIPKEMLEAVKKDYPSFNLIKKLTAEDGTSKYIFELSDGQTVESVLMKYKYGNTVCVSTQIGCRMGCKFCASTLNGLLRNLTAGEILEQIIYINAELGGSTKSRQVTNVVLMGMGEPLDNYDNVLKFLHLVSSEDGLTISQRNITLSTCGIVPKIYQLADDGVSVTFTISLHATSDEKRREFMPIANAYSIQEILKACRYYFEKTGRRIGFEYSLIAGGNDSLDEADKLSALLKGLPCHVNVIPLNSVKERALVGTNIKKAYAFVERLNKNGISATKRRTMGEDIGGACGQLRSKVLRGEEC